MAISSSSLYAELPFPFVGTVRMPADPHFSWAAKSLLSFCTAQDLLHGVSEETPLDLGFLLVVEL